MKVKFDESITSKRITARYRKNPIPFLSTSAAGVVRFG